MQIDSFNFINKTISQQAGVTYLDITPNTRLTTDSSLIALDGLHPSGKEYAIWADSLAIIIKNVLNIK